MIFRDFLEKIVYKLTLYCPLSLVDIHFLVQSYSFIFYFILADSQYLILCIEVHLLIAILLG